MDKNEIEKLNTDEYLDVLNRFAEKLIRNQEDIPAEIQKCVDDHFWEML